MSIEVFFVLELFAFFSQYLSRKVKQRSFLHTESYGLRTVNSKSVGVSKWADYLRFMYFV
jgi:hypothetical protein